jgi:hypothetical protein
LRSRTRDLAYDNLVVRSVVVPIDGDAHLTSVIEALRGGDLHPLNLEG